jgi:hypothetical protein
MAVNPITLSAAIKAALDEAFGPGFATERQAVAAAIGEAVAAAHNADAGGGTAAPPPVHTLASRPAASVALRGTRIVISDTSYQGGADVVQTCLRTSGGTYTWVDTALAAS